MLERDFQKTVIKWLRSKGCIVNGCSATVYCRSMCCKHYAQALRHDRKFIRLRQRDGKMKAHPREYWIWCGMKERCYNENYSRYKDYGGRGIKMCDRWLGANGFMNFFKDMGGKPGKGYSLDRINNDGDYCPENCKWSTQHEQAANKRNTKGRKYPVGVRYDKVKKGFVAYISCNGNRKSRRFKQLNDAITQRALWEKELVC